MVWRPPPREKETSWFWYWEGIFFFLERAKDFTKLLNRRHFPRFGRSTGLRRHFLQSESFRYDRRLFYWNLSQEKKENRIKKRWQIKPSTFWMLYRRFIIRLKKETQLFFHIYLVYCTWLKGLADVKQVVVILGDYSMDETVRLCHPWWSQIVQFIIFLVFLLSRSSLFRPIWPMFFYWSCRFIIATLFKSVGKMRKQRHS